MRINLVRFCLVVAAVVSSLLVVGAAPRAETFDDVAIEFEHVTAEGVIFRVTLSGRPGGAAAYEALLVEGEHVTERAGEVKGDSWTDLAAEVERLMPSGVDRVLKQDEERYAITFRRGTSTRVARFSVPAGSAERQLAECFGHGKLPGVIYQDVQSNPSRSQE